jgi:hypothetical protein
MNRGTTWSEHRSRSRTMTLRPTHNEQPTGLRSGLIHHHSLTSAPGRRLGRSTGEDVNGPAWTTMRRLGKRDVLAHCGLAPQGHSPDWQFSELNSGDIVVPPNAPDRPIVHRQNRQESVRVHAPGSREPHSTAGIGLVMRRSSVRFRQAAPRGMKV